METQPRRIPIVETPAPGESFTGWLTRYATALHTPVGALVDALGLPTRPHSVDARPAWADVLATSAATGAIEAATGITPDMLATAFLSTFDQNLIDLQNLNTGDETSLRLVAADQWLLTGHSRTCPDCLDTDGIWQTWWRLGLAAVCPIHRRVLVDMCTECGHPLASGVRYPRTRLPGKPWQCGHALRGARCDADLRDPPAIRAPGRAIAAQQALLAAAARGTAHLADTTVSSLAYAHEWKTIMNLLRGTDLPSDIDWPQALIDVWREDQTRVARVEGGRRGGQPATATLGAALMDTCWPLMSATDPTWEAAKLATHAATSPVRGQKRHWKAAERLPTLGRSITLTRPRQARVAGVLASTGVNVDLRTVPTTVPADVYEDRFAVLLPGTAPLTGRLYAALACARSAGSPNWAQAARAIGIPAEVGARLSNTITQRVTDPAAFAAAIHATLTEVGAANIDYTQRRADMCGLMAIPVPVLRPILRRPVTTARTIHAAAWLWEHHTTNPAKWSPAHQAARAAGTSNETLSEVYRRFSRQLTTDQQRSLAALATSEGESR